MADLFKSKKGQGKNYDNLNISLAEKLCIRFFTYNESKHSTKLLNSAKIKPYFEKFNINKVKSNAVKKFEPTKKEPWIEVSNLFGFDAIEPDPSYIYLINYLKSTDFKSEEIHNFLIPLLNDILPLYFRFLFVFTYKFKIQLEKCFSQPSGGNQNERSKLTQMIDTVEKLFWLFFNQYHQYLNETILSFQVLIDAIISYIQPLLDSKMGQPLFPIILSITDVLTKYLSSPPQSADDPKQLQPIIIDNSPIFSFVATILLNVNELQQNNLYLVSPGIISYLKLFSNESSRNIILLDDNAAFKNLDFFMFQIRKTLSPESSIKDKQLSNSLLYQTLTALLYFYLIENSNSQTDKNKSHSKVSFQTISELIIQIVLWDIKLNYPKLETTLEQNTISKRELFTKDLFADTPNNEILQSFFEDNNIYNDKIFNTLDFKSEIKDLCLNNICTAKYSGKYSISNLIKDITKFLGQIFTKKTVLFDQFLTFLKDFMKEKDDPILRLSLLKGLQESMTVTSIMNTLWHTESIEFFFSHDIYYLYYIFTDPIYWPSKDGFIAFYELTTNYFIKNPLFDNVKQYLNDILSFEIQNATPMQMASLITAIYCLFISQNNSSEQSNRLTFFYSPKSTIFDEIINVDHTYMIYLSANYDKMKSIKEQGLKDDEFTSRYYQILQVHLFILDFLNAFMSSSASVTYVFCQKSMSRVRHINFLFFDKRSQDMAMQFYSKHLSSKNSTYILLISLTNLLKQLTNIIDNSDAVDVFCKAIDLVSNVHDDHLNSLVSNIILTNFFIHLVHIFISVIQKFAPGFLNNVNENEINEINDNDSDPSNFIRHEKTISPSQIQLDQSQLKTIKLLFVSVLDFISKISCKSEVFIDHLTEKKDYYINDLITISKFVEFDSTIFNTLFSAMTGRNINDVKNMNEAEIISQVAVRLLIELTYENNFYLKSLSFIDKLTENSVSNQITCYVSGIFYFFVDHLFDKIPDLTYKIISNISQSYFDKKALIKLVNKYEELSQNEADKSNNINQQRQLKILQLFHKLLIEKPTVDVYSGSFFHVNDYRDQNVFKTSSYLVEYPIKFSFHFKLYKIPKDGFFKIVGSKKHKIKFKISKEQLIVQLISKTTLLTKEFTFPIKFKLFEWNFIEFSLTPKSFELTFNDETHKTTIDNIEFSWNSNNIYYSTKSCIMDFEEIQISHANHDLCSYSAKIVNKNLCFNIKKGEFDAKFLGPSFKYSPTFENSIRFVGGIKIILPLFNYIPTEQDNKVSEEEFLIIFDLLLNSLRKYQDQALDQHIFRILNSFFDKLNIDSFSENPGNQILQLFDIVKNPQLVKEMNAYLFSDFTLLNRFKRLLEQMLTKKKVYALQLDLSFLQAFVRISSLKDFNFQFASEYLIEVANKDKNKTQNVTYLIHFIMTNYQSKDHNLIDLSFQVLSAILNTSQFLTVFPMLSIIETNDETCQYWAIEILMKFLSLFEKDTRILIFRKCIQIVSSVDIDTALTDPQRIFYLVLYYCFNEYKQINKEEENKLIQENKKLISKNHTFQLIQVELLSIICPMLHLFKKTEVKRICKSMLSTFRSTKFSYYEFLPLMICYISTYGDFSDHNSWVELLAEIIYSNNEEKVYDEILLILIVFSILFKWNYESDLCILVLSLLKKINSNSKSYTMNPKLFMKIVISLVSQPLLSTIRKSDYTVNNKYTDEDNLIIFKKVIEIFLNDHQKWIFSVSSILPQIRTGDERATLILDIFSQLNKIIVKNPDLLLFKDPSIDLTFCQIYMISLANIQKIELIDPIAEKLSKIKENQSQYEIPVLLFIASTPNNKQLVSLYKTMISSRAKSADIIQHAKTAHDDMMHIFETSYMLKYKNSFESGIQMLSASVSRITDKKTTNEDFQQSHFEYINIQYEEQIDRMKKHNSKVCEDLLTSLQTNQNIGVSNENETKNNHYKIYMILDGNGKHSAMKRIKHFKDHHQASEKRDQIQRSRSMTTTSTQDIESPYKCIIYGIEFKLDPYEINKPSNENLFEKSCQLVEIATVFTGKISITRGSISFDSKEANRVLSSKKKDCQRFIEFNLSSLRFVFWRRFKHQLTGLEFFIRDGSSFLIQFKMPKDMQSCIKQLNDLLNSEKNYKFYVQTRPSKELSQSNFFLNNFTVPWQNGEMTNYEYLFWVNMITGRSFHDISQYPVFPWILKNYDEEFIDFSKAEQVFRNLSLPVGALDERRLEMLKENMEGLTGDDQRCLYNKHYMTAGFVTYYLMRCEPFTMMHIELQSGQFDYANRLFISVESIWNLVSGPAQNEFRELVPEFFSLPNFMKNYEKYDLGKTPEGESVDNVKLPKWSAGNPSTFIALNRLALESPYVSMHINEWIDLIFGYKSRGKAAEEANNTYHPYTYPEIIDNPEIANDPCLLTAVQDWAVNYGTCADLAFTTPHPTKFQYFVPTSPFATSSFSLKSKELNKNTTFKNPYAVSFTHVKLHKKGGAAKLFTIKFVALQHPDSIGIIKIHHGNQEKEMNTVIDNGNGNDLLDTNLENSIFNTNLSNLSILSKELCKFKTKAGTAKFLKASEMLGSLTAINQQNNLFISSAPWIDYFEVVFFNPSLKVKKKSTGFKSIIGSSANIDSTHAIENSNPSFHSQPQQSCITVLACDQWAVVTGFENSSIAVWDLRNNVANFNCNSVINSNSFRGQTTVNQQPTASRSRNLEPLFYIFGHSGSIKAVDVSVDLNLIVSVDSNNLVLMSFLSNGERIRSFSVPTIPKRVFLFSLGFVVFIYETHEIKSTQTNDSENGQRQRNRNTRISDFGEQQQQLYHQTSSPSLLARKISGSYQARSDSFNTVMDQSNPDSKDISPNEHILTTIELRDLSGRVVSETQKQHRSDVFCKCVTNDFSQYLMISFSMKLNSNSSCVFLYRIYDLKMVALKSINGKVLSADFDKKLNMFVLCIEEMPCVLLKIIPNEQI
ncbi:hypothetical protein M9Y10_024127 [Tritrichomonas musculus]|uniref:BEACH domain-containing protein n=1 Tax=Tritrichomonas musculus TaxID=1915356 RepID=A0ABR2KX31_9EUKA